MGLFWQINRFQRSLFLVFTVFPWENSPKGCSKEVRIAREPLLNRYTVASLCQARRDRLQVPTLKTCSEPYLADSLKGCTRSMKTIVVCPDCLGEQEVKEMLIERNPVTRHGLQFSLKLKCGHRIILTT